MNDSDIAVVIVASGSGSRFGGGLPKQFCLLGGRPVLMHTVDAFRRALPQAYILLMLSQQGRQYWHAACERYQYASPATAIGGDTRTETVRNAIITLSDISPRYVMIHDGARPLVSSGLIHALAHALQDGADIAVPGYHPSDSIEMTAGTTPKPLVRDFYTLVQTPQCSRYDMFAEALASGTGRRSYTDDASMLAGLLHKPITIVPGDRTNIKITYPADIAVAEALLLHPYPYPEN